MPAFDYEGETDWLKKKRKGEKTREKQNIQWELTTDLLWQNGRILYCGSKHSDGGNILRGDEYTERANAPRGGEGHTEAFAYVLQSCFIGQKLLEDVFPTGTWPQNGKAKQLNPALTESPVKKMKLILGTILYRLPAVLAGLTVLPVSWIVTPSICPPVYLSFCLSIYRFFCLYWLLGVLIK